MFLNLRLIISTTFRDRVSSNPDTNFLSRSGCAVQINVAKILLSEAASPLVRITGSQMPNRDGDNCYSNNHCHWNPLQPSIQRFILSNNGNSKKFWIASAEAQIGSSAWILFGGSTRMLFSFFPARLKIKLDWILHNYFFSTYSQSALLFLR